MAPDRHVRIKGIDASMSDSDTLHHRGKALENAFFANLDEKLVEDLRKKLCTKVAMDELREATAIQDPQVLEAVCKLGVNASTIVALRLYPLVAVAWADSELDDAERLTIRKFAAKHLANSPLASDLLSKWLERKPSEDMLDAWEAYAHALTTHMPAPEAAKLKKTLLAELNDVATASGGVFGWGTISPSEHSVVKRVGDALSV